MCVELKTSNRIGYMRHIFQVIYYRELRGQFADTAFRRPAVRRRCYLPTLTRRFAEMRYVIVVAFQLMDTLHD